jgi:hypothetical protein
MGNYHVPFWRAVEGVTPSLTLIVLKRTTGLSFAACGGLGFAQPLKQEISFVNLRSPRQRRIDSEVSSELCATRQTALSG